MSYSKDPGRCKFADQCWGKNCRFVHPDDPRWANARPAPFSNYAANVTGSNGDPVGSGGAPRWGAQRVRRTSDGRPTAGITNADPANSWGEVPAWLSAGGSDNASQPVRKASDPAVDGSEVKSPVQKSYNSTWGSWDDCTGGEWGDASGWTTSRAPTSPTQDEANRPSAAGPSTSRRDDSNASPPTVTNSQLRGNINEDMWSDSNLPTSKALGPSPSNAWASQTSMQPPISPVRRVSNAHSPTESRQRNAVPDLHFQYRPASPVPESIDHESMLAAMVLPLDVASDGMVIDDSPSLLSPPTEPFAVYMKNVVNAITLYRSLQKASKRRDSFSRMKSSSRYTNIGNAAAQKLSQYSNTQQEEIEALKKQFEDAVEVLQTLSAPIQPADTAQDEERIEQVQRFADKVQSWLAEVENAMRSPAKAPAASSVQEAELQEKVAKLEDQVAELEQKVEDLRGKAWDTAEQELDDKLGSVQKGRIQKVNELILQYPHDDVQESRVSVEAHASELRNAKQKFRAHKESIPSEDSSVLVARLRELEMANYANQAAYMENQRLLVNLRGTLESLQSSAHPAPSHLAPIPMMTEADAISILLPLLQEEVRKDLRVTLEAFREGVARQFGTLQDQLSADVWNRLAPMLEWVRCVQPYIESSLAPVGGRQASNSE